jgi:hypothetical protein
LNQVAGAIKRNVLLQKEQVFELVNITFTNNEIRYSRITEQSSRILTNSIQYKPDFILLFCIQDYEFAHVLKSHQSGYYNCFPVRVKEQMFHQTLSEDWVMWIL